MQKASADNVYKAYETARDSAIAHNSALKQQTIGAKAGSIALQGLASVGSSFASWAIDAALTAAVNGIIDLANEADTARQKSESFISTVNSVNENYSNGFSQLSDLENEYNQLSNGVNSLGENQSLPNESYERYKEVVSEISELLPDLNVRYNEQGEKIGFVTGKLKDLTSEYQKAAKQEATELYFSGDENGAKFSDTVDAYNKESSLTWGEGFANFLTGNEDDNITNLSRQQSLETRLDWSQEDFKEEYEKIVAEQKEYASNSFLAFSKLPIASGFEVSFDDLGISNYSEILDMDEAEFENFKDKMNSLAENYERGMEERASDVGTGLAQTMYMKDSYWNIEDENVRRSIDSTFSNMSYHFVKGLGTDEDGDVDAEKLEAWSNSFITAMDQNKNGIYDAWSNLISLDVDSMPVEEAAEQVDSLISQISGTVGGSTISWEKMFGLEEVREYSHKLQDNISNISNENPDDTAKLEAYTKYFNQEQTDTWLAATEGSKNAEDAIKNYEKYLSDSAPSFSTLWDSSEFESTRESLLQLAKSGQLTSDVLESNDMYAELLTTVGNNAEEAADRINHMVSSADQLSQMKTGISSISNILSQKKTNLSSEETKNKGIGADTLSSMPEEVKKSTKEYNKFVKVLGNGKSSMADCQKAADELAGAYVNSHGFLSNLTEENQDYYKSILEEMGIENSSSVIKQALANSTNTLAAEKEFEVQTGEQLSEQSADEITAFATQQAYSDSLTMSLYQLALQKQLINGTRLDFTSDIGSITELVSNIGGATTALDRLNQIKNGEANYIPSSEYNKILEAAQEEVNEALNKKPKKTKVVINSSADTKSQDRGKNTAKTTSQPKSKTEYDWIDTKLNKISKSTDRAKNAIDRMLDTKSKDGKTRNALNAITKEIKNNDKAAERYIKRANSIGLDNKYKKLVKSGKIGGKNDIQKITSDSKLQKKIEQYKTLYDKAQNCKNSMESLVSTVQELSKSLASIPLEKSEEKIDKLDKISSLASARSANKTNAKEKNEQIEKELKALRSNTGTQKAAAKETRKNLTNSIKSVKKASFKGLNAKDKNKIKKLLKSKKPITDTLLEKVRKAGLSNLYTRLIKYNAFLEANETAKYNADVAEQENTTAIREKQNEKFENIATEYENKVGLIQNNISDLDNEISIVEAKGKIVDSKYYKNKISSEQSVLKSLKDEKKALELQHQQMSEGTQEWYDQKAKIQEVENSIADCTKNMIDYRTSIRDARDHLAELKKGLNGMSTTYLSTAESYNARYEMTDSETGDFTDHGLAAMGIYQRQITNAKKNQSIDQKILNSITNILHGYESAQNKEKYLNDNDYDSIEQVISDYQKYYDLVQSDISERINGEEQIISLMKERYEADLTYLQKLIDARKESLTKEKELYEYQKSIREKTDKISDIQKQITSLRGDGSEETRAKLQSLQVNLDDAQNDLMDVEYDKYISDQQEMLDNLYAEYEALIQDAIMDVDNLLATGNQIAMENGIKLDHFLETLDLKLGNSTPDSPTVISDVSSSATAPANDGNTQNSQNAMRLIDAASNAISKRQDDSQTYIDNAMKAYNALSQPEKDYLANQKIDISKLQGSWDAYKREMRDYIDAILKGDEFVGMGSATYWVQKKKYTPNDVQKRIYNHGHKRPQDGFKYLNKKGLVLLAQKLGLGKLSTSAVSNSLLKLFNKVNYANGGIASSLNKVALENGDDGWITIKRGEAVLNPTQTQTFQEFLANMNPFVDTVKSINTPTSTKYAGIASKFEQNVGDINLNLNLHDVTDADSFIRQLQTNHKIRQAISQAVLDPVTGKGILNINHIR